MYWKCWRIKLAKIILAEDENKHEWSSCTLYIVSFSVVFTVHIGMGTGAEENFIFYTTIIRRTYQWKKPEINIKNQTYYFFN